MSIIFIIIYIQMSENNEKMIKLRIINNTDETFMTIPFVIFEKMKTLFDMYQDLAEMGSENDYIDLLPNVTNEQTVNQVVSYYQQYLNCENLTEDNLMEWEIVFFNDIGGEESAKMLEPLLTLANFINCTSLLNKGCKYIARNIIKNRSVEELRKYFGVENDFSPEEEEAIKREFSWAIDDTTQKQ
jgi:S-phase kinase-associated protein 1